jgi:hypothetical protein
MKQEKRRPTGWLIGFLAVAAAVAGAILVTQLRSTEEEGGGRGVSVADRPEQAPQSADAEPGATARRVGRLTATLPIDETGLRDAGASIRDSSPPPDPEAIRSSLRRAQNWLSGHTINPFGGTGVDSLRLFALEVQCWDRLAMAAAGPSARRALSGEVASRLRRFVDPVRLNEKLRTQAGAAAILEALILASRCDAYEIDRAPLGPLLKTLAPHLTAALDRMNHATAAMYLANLQLLGIETPYSLQGYRDGGMMARQPRETTMAIGEVRALTQEILAYTDLATRPLGDLARDEHVYLHRVLPHFTLMYTVLQDQELASDLLTCLNLAGMTETYGYCEGLRRLVERQNADGSFGSASAESDWTMRLATTAGCLTALSLEAVRVQREQ